MKLRDAEERRLVREDGSELCYQSVGRGMPVLLANGLAGSREVWRELVNHLSDRYRFLLWSYRGLSLPPSAAGAGMPEHVADALAILDAEGLTRASVIGWSLGAQVALELFRKAPARVASLTLISGDARVAWAEGPARNTRGKLIARALRIARKSPRTLDVLLRLFLQSPEAYTWARRVGAVGERISAETFAHITDSYWQLDVPAYLEQLERLTGNDSSDVLRHVDVPTLVIAGDRDPFTTRAAAERLVNDIKGAEYLLLPGATHFVLLDQPERVNLRIEKFWNERGYSSELRNSVPVA